MGWEGLDFVVYMVLPYLYSLVVFIAILGSRYFTDDGLIFRDRVLCKAKI